MGYSEGRNNSNRNRPPGAGDKGTGGRRGGGTDLDMGNHAVLRSPH